MTSMLCQSQWSPWKQEARVSLRAKQDRVGRILAKFRASLPSPPSQLSAGVQKAIRHIHENLFDPRLNVAFVRRRCALRNNNISAQFCCETGIGLREYIELGRVNAAKVLLARSKIEVYLVAASVGYRSVETFCRAFRRQVGQAPTEWRKASGNNQK